MVLGAILPTTVDGIDGGATVDRQWTDTSGWIDNGPTVGRVVGTHMHTQYM
jgi:hypothetical protein